MKQSLVELVDVILQKIQESPEVPQTESRIRSWLAGQGYNQRDIDAAIKLVRPRFSVPARAGERSPGSVRALSAYEWYKLTPEARDALARLELYELIDPLERETILDRLSHFEGEIGLDELDYLLEWVVSSYRDVESQRTIDAVLRGHTDTSH